MSKITKATLKSFIRNNKDKLYIKVSGSFDGMQDCIDFRKSEFKPVIFTDQQIEYTLGVKGAWILDTRASNSFETFKDENFTGIKVSNCCSYFTVAIPN